MKRSAARSWVVLAAWVAFSGCGGGPGCGAETADEKPQAKGCGERLCSAGTPTGVPVGLTPDGRVDVKAAVAWPNRSEPAPLTPQELADACALINTCKIGANGAPLSDADLATLTHTCATGKASANGREERGIPQNGQFERFAFEARAVLAGPQGCTAVRSQATKRPPMIHCEEVGCWWESPVPAEPECCQPVPKVTCNGDIATLVTEGLTFTRDCSRAFQKCDVRSSTGCTDRAPIACSGGTDACDGDVKLGCDGTNRVSFHDCAVYPGGKCEPNDTAATCELHESMTCMAGCDAAVPSQLDLCVGGVAVKVDCEKLGLGACIKGHCTPKG